MPTVMGHALFGMTLVNVARPWLPEPWGKISRFWPALLPMIPDADVVAFRFGVAYGDHFGHRGFTHSLVFAALIGGLATAGLAWRARRDPAPSTRRSEVVIFLLLTAVVASHPLLDMLTDGGHGVALFAPFDWDRIFFSVTPIPVSPIGVSRRLVPVLTWEAAAFLPPFLVSWLWSVKLSARRGVREP